MNPETSTVFLVDDDPVMLFLWEGILRAASKKVEAFERPEALLEHLSPHDRGCVVVDLRMPGFDGLELQRALLDRGILLPLVFVSGRAGVPDAVAAMKQGAVDFLCKPIDPGELCVVVARALQRDVEAAARRRVSEDSRARWSELSARERDVCRLFARGLLNKQIAAELGVTESTVQAQRARALQKLHVSSVVELIQLLTYFGDGTPPRSPTEA